MYVSEMLKLDSRFSEYEWFVINHEPNDLSDSINVLELEKCKYELSYTYDIPSEINSFNEIIKTRFKTK